MPHMLYDPTDEDFIQGTLDFFTHLQGCEECTERAVEEGAAQIAAVFETLNTIFMEPEIPQGDYALACDLCAGWLALHSILELVDGTRRHDGTLQ